MAATTKVFTVANQEYDERVLIFSTIEVALEYVAMNMEENQAFLVSYLDMIITNTEE